MNQTSQETAGSAEPAGADRSPPAHPPFVKPQRVAFVQSAWHRDVIEQCRIAFLAEMAARHISHIDVFEVPGSF
ncbi:6,7-dimethyl-8-ribityllumazine synthase, partial [Acinetobacter baumannii]